MDSSDFVVSADALTRVIVFVLYVPVVLICFRRLFPHMSPTARRLATIMLAAQVLILVVALENTPKWDLKGWLWHLDQEWNIPSTFASTQLALVAGVALLTAWLARSRPWWHRLYLAGIGLFFLILGQDEFFSLHETHRIREIYYVILGMTILGLTLVVAVRSPLSTWKWHICLLAGMGLTVAGAMIVDVMSHTCGRLGILQLEGCLQAYNLEESLEFLGVWLVLVAILGSFSAAAPKPRAPVRVFLFLLPVLWVLLLTNDALLPRLELQFLAQPAAVEFESDVTLKGYDIDIAEGEVALRLYMSAWRSHYSGLGYSIHIVDQASGDSIANMTNIARHQLRLLLAPGFAHIYRHRMEVAIPPQAAVDRALWIVLSLWRKDGDNFVHKNVVSSDQQLLSESQVVLGELVLPAASTPAQATPLGVFDKGFTLETADIPESVRLGGTLIVPFVWRSDVGAREDYTQYLHFVHEASGAQWGHDQQPLGARLPTRLWYKGLSEIESWQVPLPADLTPGSYAVFTGLYRASDQERLPVNDAAGKPFHDGRVPLGILIIE